MSQPTDRWAKVAHAACFECQADEARHGADAARGIDVGPVFKHRPSCDAIAAALEGAAAEGYEAVRALENLLICYRTGVPPKDGLWKRLEASQPYRDRARAAEVKP